MWICFCQAQKQYHEKAGKWLSKDEHKLLPKYGTRASLQLILL